MNRGTIATICCYAVALTFGLGGSLKLYPWNQQGFEFMETKFAEWKEVFPFAPLGVVPDPVVYRISVGIAEVTLCLLLLIGSHPVRRISAGLSMVIMAGAVQTLICHNEAMDIGPAVTIFCMCGFVVYCYGKPVADSRSESMKND